MPWQQKLLDKMLTESKIIDDQTLKKLNKEAELKKIPLNKYLISKKIVSEEVLYENLANYTDLPYINLENQTIRRDILFLIPEPIAQTHGIVAWDKTRKELKLF